LGNPVALWSVRIANLLAIHKPHSEHGAIAIEYALLATLIAIAIIAAVTGVGDKLVAMFTALAAKFP
jgi:Flp pilus assembly pilin Flp